MIGFPKTPFRWFALALGFLAIAPAGAEAAPLRYNITEVEYGIRGKGLDNDGRVIAEPIRNIVGEYVPDSNRFAGDFPSVVDGAADGRLLVNTIGKRGTWLYNSSFAHVYRPSASDGIYFQLGTANNNWSGDNWNRIQGVDMNEKGDVVGQIVGALWADGYESDPERPFVVIADTTEIRELIDLIPPDSGWRPTDVYSINDLGQILGRGTNPDGHIVNFLMTPAEQVPEPGTWAVFGLAAAAFAWRARRRAG